jgi:hypothetical protein
VFDPEFLLSIRKKPKILPAVYHPSISISHGYRSTSALTSITSYDLLAVLTNLPEEDNSTGVLAKPEPGHELRNQ